MTLTQLENNLLKTLRTYWRIRAGSTALQSNVDAHPLMGQVLHFESIPKCNSANPLIAPEQIGAMFQEVGDYISSGKLSVTFFLQLISHVEGFLCAQLSLKSLSIDGTLGQLQNRCESAYLIGSANKLRMNEIRERRNSIIHHAGAVTQKYVAAANHVFGDSGGAIPDPGTIVSLEISACYLSYCVDTLIDYARDF